MSKPEPIARDDAADLARLRASITKLRRTHPDRAADALEGLRRIGVPRAVLEELKDPPAA